MRRLLKEVVGLRPDAPETWSWINLTAAALPVAPIEKFKCLSLESYITHSGSSEIQLVAGATRSSEMVRLLGSVLFSVGTGQGSNSVAYMTAVASVEIVRAKFAQVLWLASHMHRRGKQQTEKFRELNNLVLGMNWLDASSMVVNNYFPMSIVGADESAADVLFDWTSNLAPDGEGLAFNQRLPAANTASPMSQEAILAAGALLWIDAALAATDIANALGYMAAAANAMRNVGFLSGWTGFEEHQRDTAKYAGKLGGIERHRATRELKEWALAEVAEMKGPDIVLARKLAQRVPQHLGGVSADPVRLIYEALRAVASAKRRDSR